MGGLDTVAPGRRRNLAAGVGLTVQIPLVGYAVPFQLVYSTVAVALIARNVHSLPRPMVPSGRVLAPDARQVRKPTAGCMGSPRAPAVQEHRRRATAAASDQVLVASHLGKWFGDSVAVDDVSFQVAPGETYGLLGPNGAGKTTTIRLVCGLLRPDAGDIAIAGHRVTTTSTTAKALIGYSTGTSAGCWT